MPTFDTPQPISVTIELGVGDARITASDRTETVVEVRPSDGGNGDDVRAAEDTRVEYADGRLLVKAPKNWRRYSPFSDGGSIDVTIGLPAGSHLQGDAAVAAFRGVGRLGECRLKTAAGDIQLDHTGALDASTSTGAIVVDRVAGHAEVSTGSGRIRVGEIDGTGVIKNSNGDCWVGEVAGDLRVTAANGDISIGHASGGITASTATGDIRVGDVARGSASLKTAAGDVEIGIHAGTAARLDVHTHFGTVRNEMDAADGPGLSDETVEVRARTSHGDIVIRRS
jgi:DUF4097 and DUF4098 domain-containing protein YvlB